MGVEESWSKLFDLLLSIQQTKEFYRTIEESLPSHVRGLILYDDMHLEQPQPTLVHYTSWENLLKILQVKGSEHPMLRMYNYEFANDPEEGNIKPAEWKELERRVEKLLKKYDPEGQEERARRGCAYGCSFSSNINNVEDDLMLWRLYGNDGEGASLKLGAVQKEMYKVRYRADQKQDNGVAEAEDDDVARRIDRLLKIGIDTIDASPSLSKNRTGRLVARALAQVLDGYFYLVKNKAYEHEKEWRALKIFPHEKNVKYEIGRDGVVKRYTEWEMMKNLFGSESVITLGPTVPNSGAAKGYIEKLAREHGMTNTIIKLSSRKYR